MSRTEVIIRLLNIKNKKHYILHVKRSIKKNDDKRLKKKD